MTHYARAHSLARYAAEVSSVDADAKLLEVRYVGCSPGQSVEWLTYSGNHDLAFLPMQAPAATQPAPTHAAAVLPSQSAAASGAASAAASPQAGQKDARSMDVDTTVAEGGGEGTEDDEDEQNEEEEEEQSAAAAAPAAASASTSIYVEEISLLDSDEEDGVVTTRTIEGPAAAAAVTLIASDSDGSDDEEQGAEGVVVKGASASDYPHARCNCTLRRFHVDRCRTVPTDKQNATTCKNW
jgi:pyruvate/2-oxoglutarate dehydrogenase complex dihydrolipoamide acyltransferase (E2) component